MDPLLELDVDRWSLGGCASCAVIEGTVEDWLEIAEALDEGRECIRPRASVSFERKHLVFRSNSSPDEIEVRPRATARELASGIRRQLRAAEATA